jgi:hypothetical protein
MPPNHQRTLQRRYASVASANSSIPRHIQALNHFASKSGIKTGWEIDKDNPGNFRIEWKGTEAQFIATRLTAPKFRFPLIRGQFSCPYFTGSICKTGKAYTLSFSVPFPEKVETKNSVEIIHRQGGGRWGDKLTECYGTAEALIAGGFITQDQVPGKYARKSSYNYGEGGLSWTTLRQPDGMLLYSCSTKETTKPQPRQVENNPEGFKTAEDYRQSLLKVFDVCVRFLPLDKPVETNGGHIYTVDAESKEGIKDALGDLYWAIRDAVIHTQIVPTKESREQYTKAESDHSFRNFMSGLVESSGLAKAGKQ